jgi:hypothetical protein
VGRIRWPPAPRGAPEMPRGNSPGGPVPRPRFAAASRRPPACSLASVAPIAPASPCHGRGSACISHPIRPVPAPRAARESLLRKGGEGVRLAPWRWLRKTPEGRAAPPLRPAPGRCAVAAEPGCQRFRPGERLHRRGRCSRIPGPPIPVAKASSDPSFTLPSPRSPRGRRAEATLTPYQILPQ